MAIPVDSPAQIERNDEGVTLRFEREYDRSRTAVWLALTEPAQLAEWLDEASVDLRVGGSFQVRFSDGTMNGVISELVHETVLAYSWHEGQFGQSYVRWELRDLGGGRTQLLLTHTKLRTESAAGFAAGWHHHLERMAGLLAGGSVAWVGQRFDELHAIYLRSIDPSN